MHDEAHRYRRLRYAPAQNTRVPELRLQFSAVRSSDCWRCELGKLERHLVGIFCCCSITFAGVEMVFPKLQLVLVPHPENRSPPLVNPFRRIFRARPTHLVDLAVREPRSHFAVSEPATIAGFVRAGWVVRIDGKSAASVAQRHFASLEKTWGLRAARAALLSRREVASGFGHSSRRLAVGCVRDHGVEFVEGWAGETKTIAGARSEHDSAGNRIRDFEALGEVAKGRWYLARAV